MELNQTTLRGILAAVLSVNTNHVVPKQGNWYNPQDANRNIENWCGYRIKSNKPRTLPFYEEEKAGKNTVCAVKIADIELQFVGPDAETLAQNVCLWPLRSDVAAQFKTVNGAIMPDDLTSISSVFYQDGANSVTAWNVSFRVLWVQKLETTQTIVTTVNVNGTVK